MRAVLKIAFLFLFFLTFSAKCFASDNSFVTIVNPVRISAYNFGSLASLQYEYDQVKSHDFPATWLVTYDVLQKEDMVAELAKMDKKQEVGLFLEIRPKLAADSGVSYHLTGQWYRATSLFLSGYLQFERRKLIDTLFNKFKSDFGYYPKSVGAWWVDSYALEYMKDKYGITGVLGVSDQYDLDGYQVWGTPWSTPYYPSKINAAIPAASTSNKLNLVEFRWASRDPLNGYKSPSSEQASIYSTQDYERLGFTSDYFKSLVQIYSIKNDQNKFGQITVGLEADYDPKTYRAEYSAWMDILKNLQDEESIKVTSMKDFSKWYISNFPNLNPASFIYSDDILGTQKKAFWFQSPKYRIGLVYDKDSQTVKIQDLRIYYQNLFEPFYSAPNGQYFLSINLPYIIDSIIEKNSGWDYSSGKLVSVDKNKSGATLIFENGQIVLGSDFLSFKNFKVPKKIIDLKQFNITQNGGSQILYVKTSYPIDQNGIEFSDFTPHIPFAIKHRIERNKMPVALVLVIFTLVLAFLFFKNKKLLLYCFIVLFFAFGAYFMFQLSNKYYVSQTEYDALQVLSHFPKGNVLVYDKDCIRCSFTSKYKPAAMAGVKSYVSKYSGKKSVLDYDFQTAASSQIAKEALNREKIKYVYLSKYEGFIESLPYIPRDLGLVRLYENANAEIWEVK